MTAHSHRKSQLDARLTELEARLHGIEAELDSHNSPDWEDLASERESDEVLEDLGAAGQAEIRQIKAALQRIAEGSYGECAKCGAEIDAARLDILPHSPFCSACAV